MFLFPCDLFIQLFLFSADIFCVGLFMPKPSAPVTKDLETFMQSSGDDGVILVSFGTVVDDLNEERLKTMINAFSQLKQKVLWKVKGITYIQDLFCFVHTSTVLIFFLPLFFFPKISLQVCQKYTFIRLESLTLGLDF